jgi:hypothetical protein
MDVMGKVRTDHIQSAIQHHASDLLPSFFAPRHA